MERYNEYKDSGVQWLGEIPRHWEMLPGRVLFKENKSKNDGGNRNVLSLSYGKIIIKKDTNEGLVPAEYSNYQIIKPGYIIVRCTDLQNDKVSLRTAVSDLEGIITGAYLGIIPYNTVNSHFLHYLLRAWDNCKELYRYGSGLRQSLSWVDFKYLQLPVPSREEQNAMVAYLDKTTAKIDEAIAQQQKMIDLLNERKQIIINNAVTKGLNPNAPMKDSGVDWIGEIPEHWKLMPLKHMIKFISGYAFDSNDFKLDGDIPVIRISNISDGQVCLDDITYVSHKKELDQYVTKKGDLLIAMSGATTGKVGFDYDGGLYINQRVGAIRSEYPQFVYYWLNSTFFKEYVWLSALGSAQPNISSKGISNFMICLPTKCEIEEINCYLRRELDKFDTAISNATKQISLLQERKQIIINDVVTGKIKVTE